jgi:glycosyltransferase involved in cell wall biosynthesis
MKESVGIVINTLLLGGAEKQAVILSKALQDKFDVFLVVLYGDMCDPRLLGMIENDNVQVIRLDGSFINRIWKFYHILKSKNTIYLFSYLATANVVAGIIGKLSGVKYLIGGIRNSELSPFKQNIQRFLHNRVFNYSVFNNFSGANSLSERGFINNKIHVIPNCFDLTISPAEGVIRKEITILSVGRFVEQKDYLTAIKAIAKLKRLINHKYTFRYNIVGYGKLEEDIKSYINKYELAENVKIIINPKDINNYYKKADVFLNTSLFEGQSNSIMEAMSFSLPVICTDAGDNSKLVLNGVNGYLADIKDYNMLADHLYSFCNSFELRNELGTKSYYHLKKNFSFTAFQKNYIELIRNITI